MIKNILLVQKSCPPPLTTPWETVLLKIDRGIKSDLFLKSGGFPLRRICLHSAFDLLIFFMITTSLLSTETFSQPYRTFINTRGHYAYNNGNGWSIFTRTEKMQIRARGTHGINLSSLRLSCMTRLQSRCWFPEKQEILFRLDLILDYFFVLCFSFIKNM